MRIDKICKTCGFDSNGVCGMYTTCKEGEECDDWEASLEYYTEITKKAPWYIKKPYDQCKISYEKFLDLLQQDEQGVGVEINIYDAIEKVYELNSVELAGMCLWECWDMPALKERYQREKDNFQAGYIFRKASLMSFYLHSWMH